jgi:hypothetical protein
MCKNILWLCRGLAGGRRSGWRTERHAAKKSSDEQSQDDRQTVNETLCSHRITEFPGGEIRAEPPISE